MKKLFLLPILLIGLFLTTNAFAANSSQSCAESFLTDDHRVILITCAFVGDDADGSVPNATSTMTLHGTVVKICTDPGSPAPTDNWDLAVLEANYSNGDFAGGGLVDRDTTVSECLPFSPGLRIDGTITSVVSGNSVNSAVGTIYITIELK